MMTLHERKLIYNQRHWVLQEQFWKVQQSWYDLFKDYKSRPTEARRDIDAPNALERLYCAAILQHQTDVDDYLHGANAWSLTSNCVDGMSVPICRGWYGDLVKVDLALRDWAQEEYTGADPNKIEEALYKAEEALKAAQELYNKMLDGYDSSSYDPSKKQLFEVWEVVCQMAKEGEADFETTFEALQGRLGTHQRDTMLSKDHRPTLFEYEVPIPDPPPFVPKVWPKFDPSFDYSFLDSDNEETNEATTAAAVPIPPPIFTSYNNAWKNLDPLDQGLPFPSATLKHDALRDKTTLGVSLFGTFAWDEDTIMRFNAGLFFMAGFHVKHDVSAILDKKLEIGTGPPIKNVEALRKHLRQVETMRWHGDKLSKRTGTGTEGADDTLAQWQEMRAVWDAIGELLEKANEFVGLGKGEQPLEQKKRER